MSLKLRTIRRLQITVALVLLASGCSELKWCVSGPIDGHAPSVGPLRIEVMPIDTADLKGGHPFRWRGSKTAGFLLFDVRITNTGDEDLLCQVGHLDFPGVVTPEPTLGHILEGAMSAWGPSGEPRLVAAADLRLTALPHEKATILTADGYRYQILNYHDFSERYCYLMQKEMERARGLAYIPYVGGFISIAEMSKAAKRRPKRLMRAEQMVMRPGVVPAGSTIRGYLTFAWPPDIQPGKCTLRLPVQPGHAASVQFAFVRRD
ncbi:MAG: hypothetical protein ACYSUI_19700 [Planctomycetota bacterium]|jgi:hypothetical protein